VDHAADLELGRLVAVEAEKGDDLTAIVTPEEVAGDARGPAAQRRVLELEATAVGGETRCFERFDRTELLFVEAAGNLDPAGG
jgi:hypothetical protein